MFYELCQDSHVLKILDEIIYDPEHDDKVYTNPSLSQLKGAVRKWDASGGGTRLTSRPGSRYIVMDGKLHFGSGHKNIHNQIARKVAGEGGDNPYAPTQAAYKGGHIYSDELSTLKTTKELHDWAHNNWHVEVPGGGKEQRFYRKGYEDRF
jgi:hypothetical protein